MIKINIKRQDNNIKEVIVIGHAKYDKYGKDIVCAAVSSTVITSINVIEKINENAIKYSKIKDELIIQILNNDDIVLKIIDNMIAMLYEIKEDYPKYIKINEEV